MRHPGPIDWSILLLPGGRNAWGSSPYLNTHPCGGSGDAGFSGSYTLGPWTMDFSMVHRFVEEMACKGSLPKWHHTGSGLGTSTGSELTRTAISIQHLMGLEHALRL